MQWYRAYEGLVSDPKLHEIALDCKVSRSMVIAVWHSILESCAAEESERFSITSKRISINLHEKIEKIEKILKSFSEKEMIVDGCVFRWSERQFQSDTSTPRVKRYRERKKMQESTPGESPQGNVSETLHETTLKRYRNGPEQNRARTEQNRTQTEDAPRPVFVPPSLLEVSDYCHERANLVNPESWLSYYQSNGWRIGKNAMKDWKAAVRSWEVNGISKAGTEGWTREQIQAHFEAEEKAKEQNQATG